MAAYADHAYILGVEDDEVYAFFHEALNFLTKENPDVNELTAMCLRCGEVNLRVMQMLDQGHTSTYGHPQPTEVRVTPIKGKAILISGHDMKDLEELLKQTQGKGINILHPRRNDTGPWLSQTQRILASCRQLWRCLAGSMQGIRSIPRRDFDDH